MSHFTKLEADLNVAPLMAQLRANEYLYGKHTYRTKTTGSPHTQTSDIWLRFRQVDELTAMEKYKELHIPVWYPAAKILTEAVKLCHYVMAAVEGDMLGGVLITKVPPGGVIAPHIDNGWHVEYYEKLYLSLQSAPGAKFACVHLNEMEVIEPKTGDLWLFDNRKQHMVQNASDVDRITLIICVRTAMFGRF